MIGEGRDDEFQTRQDGGRGRGGVGLGAAFGAAMGDVPIGIAMGIAVGAAASGLIRD